MQLFLHNFDTEDAKEKTPVPRRALKINDYICNYLVWLGKNFANDLIKSGIHSLLPYQKKQMILLVINKLSYNNEIKHDAYGNLNKILIYWCEII